MALKTFRPLTPTNRFKALPAFDEITKVQAGEDPRRDQDEDRRPQQQRRITTRHIGGGHKQKYRNVDFKRKKRGVAAEVIAIEYDPNRTARIALIKYADGEKSLHPRARSA